MGFIFFKMNMTFIARFQNAAVSGVFPVFLFVIKLCVNREEFWKSEGQNFEESCLLIFVIQNYLKENVEILLVSSGYCFLRSEGGVPNPDILT